MYNEPQKQEFYQQLDNTYFWLSAHYVSALHLLRSKINDLKASHSNQRLKILDAGCGSGKFVERLKKVGADIVGIDYSLEALQYCRNEFKIPVLRSDLEHLGLISNQFDALVSLEVLEHVTNDTRVLQEFYRVMKPGAIGLITVPAFQILWGPHDEWFGHVRRYRKSDLKGKLEAAGFEIIQISYFKCVFFLPMLILRKLKKWLGLYETNKTDYIFVPKLFNKILEWVILLEIYSGIYKVTPFGAHVIALLRKPLDEKSSK